MPALAFCYQGIILFYSIKDQLSFVANGPNSSGFGATLKESNTLKAETGEATEANEEVLPERVAETTPLSSFFRLSPGDKLFRFLTQY